MSRHLEELKGLVDQFITVDYEVYGIPHKCVGKLTEVTPEAIFLEGMHPIYFQGPIRIKEIYSQDRKIYPAAHS